MRVECFVSGQVGTNCYICFDDITKEAFCVDVSDALPKRYFEFTHSNDLKVNYLLLTHGHFDHTLDLKRFHEVFPSVPIVISREDYEQILMGTYAFCPPSHFCKPDIFASDALELPFSEKNITVMATPGHSVGSVCYIYEDLCFCGDTVFAGSVGRTDLATGSFTTLKQSIKKMKELGNKRLYPGHMEPSDIVSEMHRNIYFQ